MRARVLACISFLLFPATSLADEAAPPTDTDPKALYEEAVRAMDRGDHALACRTLERVVRMVPDGVGAKFTLAECHEEAGRLASAFRMFLLVEKDALERGQTERSEKAAARAAALKPKLGRLKFVVPASLASGFDLELRLGETAIDSSKWGNPYYVDAGTHRIIVEAKGGRRWEKKIQIADGEAEEIRVRDIMNLDPRATKASDIVGDPTASGDSMAMDADPNASSRKPGRPFPVWQVLAGGLGLAAIGAGVAFKLDSHAAERDLVDHCGEDLVCQRGIGYDPADDNARKNRGFGLFVGFTGVGVVAIGAAAIGMAIRPPATKDQSAGITVTPSFSPAFGGAILSGRF